MRCLIYVRTLRARRAGTHKVHCALGQTEQGLNADDLAGRGGHGLVFLRQQAQIAQMLIWNIARAEPPFVLFFHSHGIIAHFLAKQKAVARNFGLRPDGFLGQGLCRDGSISARGRLPCVHLFSQRDAAKRAHIECALRCSHGCQFFLQSLDLDQRLLRLELLGLGLGQMQGQDTILKLSADVLGLQLLADHRSYVRSCR